MGVMLDLIELLLFLLPGFVTTAIFYNLTSYTKPSQFERIIQALIFTLFIAAGVGIIEYLFLKLNQLWSIGQWNETLSIIFSVFIAIGLALLLSYFANSDIIHKWLRDKKITRETSYPSEWFGSFLNPAFVILHLNDGSRLYGWPDEWPSEPTKGHFSIADPSWIGKDGEEKRMIGINSILIDVKDVKWVEFLEELEESQNG